MTANVSSRQLMVIHLTDVHFGKVHTFAPPMTPGGDTPSERDYPRLLDSLAGDLAAPDPDYPVLIAITGDMAQTGSYAELSEAEAFIRDLADTPILGRPRGLSDIFVTPGNHDVVFDKPDKGERWQQWIDLHNRLRGTSIKREEPWNLDDVYDRVDDLGAVVATINSSIFVQKDKPDETRGRVEEKQIEILEQKLEVIDKQRLKSAVRIALIHHHPVLIPGLVEPGRGYDAVHNSGALLSVLRRFGFHVLLHGHKHNPYVFTEDTFSAYRKGESYPLLVVAGGSAGSTELPVTPPCGNCYNQVLVKWNSHADQTRLQVSTRQLRRHDADGVRLSPWRWKWETLRTDDRQFIGGRAVPVPVAMRLRPFDAEADASPQAIRSAEYTTHHFYFPVSAVMPSLEPSQINEARLWIVRHSPPDGVNVGSPIVRAVWSAGPNFPVVAVEAADDPYLCAVLHYYAPMLVQVKMEFEGGEVAEAHIYVRLPEALAS